MKISRIVRLLGTVSTLWACLVSAELPGVHTCAIHSPAAQSSQHHASHSHSSGDTQAPHRGQCSCLGTQCSTPLFTPDFPTTVAEPGLRAQLITAVIPPDDERLPRPLEFRTVLPNGPPFSNPTHLLIAA